MKTFTAQSTLSIANRVRTSKVSGISKRLQIIAPILCITLLVALGSSICTVFFGTENSEARKALLSINILSILLTMAGVYALCGVFGNAYWLEREDRVDAESELREVVDSMPAFLKMACMKIPKLEEFNALVASKVIEPENASDTYFEIAASLADEKLVSQLRIEMDGVESCETDVAKESFRVEEVL